MAFDFFGRNVSMFPIGNDAGTFNQVDGVRLCASEILAVLLAMRGEVYLMPSFGLAPELFEPLSGYRPELWVYTAKEEILKWCSGIIENVAIEIGGVELYGRPDTENRLHAQITFVPKAMPEQHLLAFGWYAYQGAPYKEGLQLFLNDITLDGDRFTGLTG